MEPPKYAQRNQTEGYSEKKYTVKKNTHTPSPGPDKRFETFQVEVDALPKT
jgi:hypothetical protein